jgi:hypothetical protein
MLPLLEKYELISLKAYDLAIMKEALMVYESNISSEEKTKILTELKCKLNNKINISPF